MLTQNLPRSEHSLKAVMDLPTERCMSVRHLSHRTVSATLGHDLITDNKDRDATAIDALRDADELAGQTSNDAEKRRRQDCCKTHLTRGVTGGRYFQPGGVSRGLTGPVASER